MRKISFLFESKIKSIDILSCKIEYIDFYYIRIEYNFWGREKTGKGL